MRITVVDKAVKIHPVGVLEPAVSMTVSSRSRDDCAMTGVAFHASMSL